jgi:hypothetical protein
MRIALFVTLLGALAACGPTSGKGSMPTFTSVSGSEGGQSFAVKDAVGLYDTTREYSGVIITDFSGSCTLLASGMCCGLPPTYGSA